MTSWVRLWHDMPTDPKFRTIARAAKQPLPVVVSIFTFMLADASANENERGRTTATDEDIASAFDIEESDVSAVRQAMQGRVLDGNQLAGWEKRQPKKEDNSAERAKAWRAQKQAEADAERSRTIANDEERPDAEADTDQNQIEKSPPSPPPGEGGRLFSELSEAYPSTPNTKGKRAEGLFLKLQPSEQAQSIAAAHVVGADAKAEQQRRGRTAEEHAKFITGLDTWLRAGSWRSAGRAPTPIQPMTELDRERDADLWAACELVMGKKAPTSGMTWKFFNTVIEKARAVA